MKATARIRLQYSLYGRAPISTVLLQHGRRVVMLPQGREKRRLCVLRMVSGWVRPGRGVFKISQVESGPIGLWVRSVRVRCRQLNISRVVLSRPYPTLPNPILPDPTRLDPYPTVIRLRLGGRFVSLFPVAQRIKTFINGVVGSKI